MLWDIRTPDKWKVRLLRAPLRAGILAGLTIGATLPTICFAAPSSKSVEIWQQKHGYLGALEVILAPDAVKISEKGKDIVILAKAPDWKVIVYNKKSKLFYDMTLEVWKKHGLRATWTMMPATSEWPIVKAGNEKILNRDADVYFLAADPNAKAKLRMHKPIDFSYGKAGIFWIDKTPCPKERTAVIVQLYRTPEVVTMPLALKTFHKGSYGYAGASGNVPEQKQMLLETHSISKAIMPGNIFDLPQGYKRAQSDHDVTIRKTASDSLDSIVDQMGLKDDLK
ncbi:MAG: hypothetical protein K2Y39_20930 [Candidatus Obscuribacterales bacterium]|nr:hypothetical protein [Candidatus Obscuribacterales bacterium]